MSVRVQIVGQTAMTEETYQKRRGTGGEETDGDKEEKNVREFQGERFRMPLACQRRN